MTPCVDSGEMLGAGNRMLRTLADLEDAVDTLRERECIRGESVAGLT